ncbi:MAG: DUF1634 domain-containing protein [Chryseobacterium sp.]|nr:MAG: DUF1634 domain-containing protein [Chryseobacterium sp.]
MKKTFKDRDLNQMVGNLLRAGVLLSVLVAVIGATLLAVKGELSLPVSYGQPAETENRFVSFWSELITGEPVAVLELGILILLFTPVMRVIFAIIGYAREKDYLYVAISTVVLAIIIGSIALGAAA